MGRGGYEISSIVVSRRRYVISSPHGCDASIDEIDVQRGTMSDTEHEGSDSVEVSLQESSSVPELQDVLLEQETQFGANVQDVTDTSRPVSTALVTSDVEDLEPTPVVQQRHVHMADPETTAEFPEETEEEKQERLELVSKQSRPFLLFKCVQCGFAAMILALALTTWPVMLVRGNIHLAMQPLVAFVTFLIYCPVVFFGYTFHLNTPAVVMLAMDALGAVYFTFAAIVYGVYWADLEFILSQAPPSTGTPPPVTELEQIKVALEAIGVQNDVHICSDRILMQCLLTCSAATTFIGDVFLTLKYLVFRRIPLVGKHRPTYK